MKLDEIDELLQRYTAAEHRVATNLHDLEGNSAYQFLSTEAPTGVTGQKIGKALDARGEVWSMFLALQSALSRARTLRSSSRFLSGAQRADLGKILTGPSVYLIDDPTRPARDVPIEAALSEIRGRYEELRDGVVAIEKVMLELLPRLTAVRQSLERVRQDSVGLDLDRRQLADAEARLEALQSRGSGDPLSVRHRAVDELEAQVRGLSKSIAAARNSRDNLHGDLSDASAKLSEIREVRAVAETGRKESFASLANPIGLVRVPGAASIDAPRGIAADLQRITASNAPWREVREMLDDWNRRGDRLLRQLKRAEAVNRSGLERRDELRGLLRGYRAKMSRLGLHRDPVLSEVADEAHNELYTAPTDLGRADQLVRELGQQLHQQTV